MNTFTRFRRAAAVTMTAALAGGTIALAGGAAHATPAPRVTSCYEHIQINDNAGYRGWLDYSQNPNDCHSKGDSFRMCDTVSDGIGLYAEMIGYDTWTSTQGHTAGYCSPWVGYNLPEGTPFKLNIDEIQGGVHYRIITLTMIA